MYGVAVLGDQDSVMGFRALGMTVIEIDEPKEVIPAIDQLMADRYSVVFLTEALAEHNQDDLRKYRDRALPSIIPIPSMKGSTGFGMRQIRESVRRAVGINLFDQEDSQNQP
jgi:V/A-type H+/Na+-transporting ATPase subunit F